MDFFRMMRRIALLNSFSCNHLPLFIPPTVFHKKCINFASLILQPFWAAARANLCFRKCEIFATKKRYNFYEYDSSVIIAFTYECIFTLLIDSRSPWGNMLRMEALAMADVSGPLNLSLNELQCVSTYCLSKSAAIWRTCKTPSCSSVSSVSATPYSKCEKCRC